MVETRTSGRQFTAPGPPRRTDQRGPWQASTPTLEELLLAYLRSPDAPPLISPSSCVGDIHDIITRDRRKAVSR